MTSAVETQAPEASKDQGEIAMKFLDLCHQIENCDKQRDLTAKEEEVKDSALTCLMLFFHQNPPPKT